MPLIIRPVSPTELDIVISDLVELLRETVNGGSSLGFIPPLAREEAREYWLSLRPALQAGSRLLLAAYADSNVIGSVQMSFPLWPNARHRAEIQKLFVAPALRGQGVGRALMVAIHDAARERGRSLLLLNTRHRGPAEGFYKDLGYREIGVIPGYAAGPSGERYADVALYQELSL
jgi:ribosomal protein S18 acetylase RimI-like enzyme